MSTFSLSPFKPLSPLSGNKYLQRVDKIIASSQPHRDHVLSVGAGNAKALSKSWSSTGVAGMTTTNKPSAKVTATRTTAVAPGPASASLSTMPKTKY